jgi:membrane-associated protease RseP (regulator of RpoE activity)
VSSNLPEFSPESSSWEKEPVYLEEPSDEPGPPPREWIIAAILFGATVISTTFAGLFYFKGDIGFFRALRSIILHPSLMLYGLPFSIPLISILLAHELGHFIACRYYGMRCTPPFFLPFPISIVGTLGAFIKIKSPFRHKRALFDIGVAGPLAGFIFTIPTLWIGISRSRLIPKGILGHGGFSFGEPLIFRLIGMLASGYSPSRHDMLANPIAMAGWFGLLATSLNLLPIWQLDGGHIAYAIFGRSWQKALSIIAILPIVVLGLLSWRIPTYLFIGILLLILGTRLRFYHPPTLFDEDELGPGRLLIGLLALLILILSFTPIPISIT